MVTRIVMQENNGSLVEPQAAVDTLRGTFRAIVIQRGKVVMKSASKYLELNDNNHHGKHFSLNEILELKRKRKHAPHLNQEKEQVNK